MVETCRALPSSTLLGHLEQYTSQLGGATWLVVECEQKRLSWGIGVELAEPLRERSKEPQDGSTPSFLLTTQEADSKYFRLCRQHTISVTYSSFVTLLYCFHKSLKLKKPFIAQRTDQTSHGSYFTTICTRESPDWLSNMCYKWDTNLCISLMKCRC